MTSELATVYAEAGELGLRIYLDMQHTRRLRGAELALANASSIAERLRVDVGVVRIKLRTMALAGLIWRRPGGGWPRYELRGTA